MQFRTMGPEAGPAFSQLGNTMESSAVMVDVSRHARRLCLGIHLTMDSEAFGVLVTRRPDAKASSLTPYEESRLLDVLVHMKEAMSRIEEGQDECEFSVWAISSDARDSRARAVWMTMVRNEDRSYGLLLSDA